MADTSVKFNGISLTDKYVVGNVVRPLPTFAAEITEVPGDGDIFRYVEYSPIEISMTVSLQTDSPEGKRGFVHDLMEVLNVSSPGSLQFGDEDKYYLAVPSGQIETAVRLNSITAEVVFTVPHPAMYGETKIVTLPSGGSVDVEIGGNYPTFLKGSGSVKRDATTGYYGVKEAAGDYLHILTGSSANRALVFDCENRTCTVSGANTLPSLDSDWLKLTPGKHTIVNDLGTGSMQLSWIERWL